MEDISAYRKAARRARERFAELGYGGRGRYRSLSDLGDGVTPPFPYPRRGTQTEDDLKGVTAVVGHDLKTSGLKFKIRPRNWHINVWVEHFVLMRLENAKAAIYLYVINLRAKDRSKFLGILLPFWRQVNNERPAMARWALWSSTGIMASGDNEDE